MPTVGWIQESGWDRLSDAFPFQNNWKPEPIKCPLCARSFLERAELSTHLGVDHPLKLPMLRIGNRVGFSACVVREANALKDMEVFSATECLLSTNGGKSTTVPPGQLARRLLGAGNAHHQIRLRNDREIDGRQAEAELEIRVAIPDPEILKQIDAAFLKRLAVEHPTITDADHFLHAVPKDPVVADYRGALADYVVGIIIKEQDRAAGAVAGFDAFKDKLGSARRVLADFDRPLSQAVLAAIDFNLNHFTPAAPTAVELLRAAHRFFASFTVSGSMPKAITPADRRRDVVAACPIDRATNAILEALAEFPRVPDLDRSEAVLPGLEGVPLSEYDLAKISTLRAGAAVLLGKKEAAQHHLRQIQHDYHFGAWANTQLENLSQS